VASLGVVSERKCINTEVKKSRKEGGKKMKKKRQDPGASVDSDKTIEFEEDARKGEPQIT